MHKNTTVLLIGNGQLASHLKKWNGLLEQPNHLLTWNRTESTEQLEENLKKTNIVWLAINDSAIEDFYNEYLKKYNLITVHFSGALSIPNLISCHPLMTFASQLYDFETYNKIHFVIENTDKLKTPLPNFTNSYTVINSNSKALYHALCVSAGNFPQMLWAKVQSDFEQLNIPNEALNTYVNQVAHNFTTLGSSSVTGPFKRSDHTTIEKNIEALSNNKLQSIYLAFKKEFLK